MKGYIINSPDVKKLIKVSYFIFIDDTKLLHTTLYLDKVAKNLIKIAQYNIESYALYTELELKSFFDRSEPVYSMRTYIFHWICVYDPPIFILDIMVSSL